MSCLHPCPVISCLPESLLSRSPGFSWSHDLFVYLSPCVYVSLIVFYISERWFLFMFCCTTCSDNDHFWFALTNKEHSELCPAPITFLYHTVPTFFFLPCFFFFQNSFLAWIASCHAPTPVFLTIAIQYHLIMAYTSQLWVHISQLRPFVCRSYYRTKSSRG